VGGPDGIHGSICKPVFERSDNRSQRRIVAAADERGRRVRKIVPEELDESARERGIELCLWKGRQDADDAFEKKFAVVYDAFIEGRLEDGADHANVLEKFALERLRAEICEDGFDPASVREACVAFVFARHGGQEEDTETRRVRLESAADQGRRCPIATGIIQVMSKLRGLTMASAAAVRRIDIEPCLRPHVKVRCSRSDLRVCDQRLRCIGRVQVSRSFFDTMSSPQPSDLFVKPSKPLAGHKPPRKGRNLVLCFDGTGRPASPRPG
jgi:hypothetical protein